MKATFLFPHQFRKIGWLIFIPSLIAAIILVVNGYDGENYNVTVPALLDHDLLGDPEFFVLINNGISDEIVLIFIVVGGILAGFSKVRHEDEMIAKIRLESLVWAIYVNFAVMIFATLFVYGLFYLNVMMVNMFTVLFFFIIRFHLMLYKLRKSVSDEE